MNVHLECCILLQLLQYVFFIPPWLGRGNDCVCITSLVEIVCNTHEVLSGVSITLGESNISDEWGVLHFAPFGPLSTHNLKQTADNDGYDSLNETHSEQRAQPTAIETSEVSLQTEEASPICYERNVRLMQAELDDRDALLNGAVEWGKQQEWNATEMHKGALGLAQVHDEALTEIGEKVTKLDNLLFSLSQGTSEQVREEGLLTLESLRKVLRKTENLHDIARTATATALMVSTHPAQCSAVKEAEVADAQHKAAEAIQTSRAKRHEVGQRNQIITYEKDERNTEATCAMCPVM